MNDFTKDELQILSEYLDYPIEEIAGYEGNRLQLSVKLQSLIDNYCEHEWNHGGADCIACAKCEKEVFYL